MNTITPTALDLVLDEINQLREDLGLGPALDTIPCGEPRHAANCPFALALGHGAMVTRGVFWLYDDDTWNDDDGHDVPPALQEFIVAFDDGAYPHLEWRTA